MSKQLVIREVRASDAEKICQLCADTVRNVNKRDYSQVQIDKWAGRLEGVERMRSRLKEQTGYVATYADKLIGVVTRTNDGYLDLFYIHAQHQREGIGTELMHKLLENLTNGTTLISDVSITARPFFEKFGFQIVEQQTAEIDGISFVNFAMRLLRTE